MHPTDEPESQGAGFNFTSWDKAGVRALLCYERIKASLSLCSFYFGQDGTTEFYAFNMSQSPFVPEVAA